MNIADLLGGGGYGGYGSFNAGATIVGMVLAIVLAIGGGIALYFTFLSPKNEGKFTGFLGWLYDFLNFKKLMIESLLRILYLIITVYIVCAGFSLLFSSFLGGLIFIILGLVITRICYEFVLLQILLYRNTADINKKMGSLNSSSNISTPVEAEPVDEPEITVPGPKTCPICNSEVSEDAKFCVTCGSKQD